MKIEKNGLLQSLPLAAGDLRIRRWTRQDVDRRAAWPKYPKPYAAFNGTLHRLSPSERDEYFKIRDEDVDRITLAVEHITAATIGHVVLKDIDWARVIVGNMGVRVHPCWCDRGIGTTMLAAVVGWLADHGVTRIALDVAAANARALRCYGKVGFVQSKGFDRDGVPFVWMEWKPRRRATAASSRVPRRE
ncbi:MAG: GNAT family N-acetyltransferase [bacterium]